MNKDDVEWLTEAGVTYTWSKFNGASEYHYKSFYIPANKSFDSAIYGVTKDQGDKLIAMWSTRRPDVWKYLTAEQYAEVIKPKMDYSRLPVSNVVFFILTYGKYMCSNGEEVTTEMLMEMDHYIDKNKGYMILKNEK